MITTDRCEYCNHSMPLSSERCPHCARPGLFANVRTAQLPEEQMALDERHRAALSDAEARDCVDVVRDFELKVVGSQAVIARSLSEVQRLANSDNELYATYYELKDARVRLPKGDKWDVLRTLTDDALFPEYKEEIRFGALSLDGRGVARFGECHLVLREDMIAHRTSVFEENSVVWMDRHDVRLSNAHNLPRGYRASWDRRSKLATAKLAPGISKDTRPDEYAHLLLRDGGTPDQDSFVEAHIWGPMTVRTIERVRIQQPKRKSQKALLRALAEKLKRMHVVLEVI